MTTTSFTSGTVVTSDWLNDVDTVVYEGPYNVKLYGATGDGVTDDTAEIQAAIDAVPAYGGSVYFPKGVYLISSTLTLPESRCIKLYGDGNCSVNNGFYGSVIKKSVAATGAAIEVNTDASSIEYLTVQGVAGNSGDGIVIKASRVTLRDVSVFLMGNDGIRIGTDAGGENCNLWYLDNCKTKNNTRHGVYISEGAGALADANAGTCVHLDTQSNGTDGLSLNGTQLSTFIGGAYQNNGRYGVLFSQYAEYNCLIGGDIEANTSAQIRIDSGSENNYIHNMTIAYSALNIAATTENNRIEVLDHNRLISGVKFPPTQVASTDANTLDDYEEGTFTPVLRDNNGGNAATAGTTVGRYTKIGKRVFIDITLLNIDTTGLTAGNQIVITGLPFTSETSTNAVSLIDVLRDNVSATTGSVLASIGSNVSHMTLVQNTTTGLSSMLVSTITSGSGDLYLSGSYIASA